MKSSEFPPITNTIFSSDRFSVRLTASEYAQYKSEETALHLHWMRIEFKARGIWATNQNKYVKSITELNDWDIKPKAEVIK